MPARSVTLEGAAGALVPELLAELPLVLVPLEDWFDSLPPPQPAIARPNAALAAMPAPRYLRRDERAREYRSQ
jgi:hypothetical protein